MHINKGHKGPRTTSGLELDNLYWYLLMFLYVLCFIKHSCQPDCIKVLEGISDGLPIMRVLIRFLQDKYMNKDEMLNERVLQ